MERPRQLAPRSPPPFDEAEQAYRKAIEIDPNFASPWNNLGNLLKNHLRRFDEAEQAYRKAIEIDPNFAYPHAGISDLYDTLQRPEESRHHALQAALLNPSDGWPRSQSSLRFAVKTARRGSRSYPKF
ncbi:MAG: tetratricopeptide repeat protein [Verrucomicrobiales bacterium]